MDVRRQRMLGHLRRTLVTLAWVLAGIEVGLWLNPHLR
jgi:hypothetical protein